MDLSHHSQSLYQLNLVADPSGVYGVSHPAKNKYVRLIQYPCYFHKVKIYLLEESQVISVDNVPSRRLNLSP